MSHKFNALEELIRIDKYADRWCQENGYHIRRKQYKYKKLRVQKDKWNAYMRQYRKRPYVKAKAHEYYLTRIIKQAKEANEHSRRQ